MENKMITLADNLKSLRDEKKQLEDKLKEAVIFIKGCMETKPFEEFNLPLIAEASAGKTFGTMEELEDI